MQQTADINWYNASRLQGIFKYYLRTFGKVVLTLLLAFLGVELLVFLMPLVFPNFDYSMQGVSTNYPLAFMVSLFCALTAAGKGARFLLRFGTARFPVWLGTQISLTIATIAFAVGTFLLSIIMAQGTIILSNLMPTRYAFVDSSLELTGSTLFSSSILEVMSNLPRTLLYLCEWSFIIYLFACCYRKNKVLTIVVVVGIPVALFMLTLVPAFRDVLRAVDSGNNQQISILGIQWIKVINDIMVFVEEKWQTLQLCAALASLPLSYLCMRNTKQP